MNPPQLRPKPPAATLAAVPADVLAAALDATGETDAHALLAGSIDEDGDGALGREELLTFFLWISEGAPVWPAEAAQAGGDVPRIAADSEYVVSGVPPGEPAPDFTLEPPRGGEPVTLSDFAGDRPVALVFGSYT